jgi:predicted PurR-regulated permease PerM
MVKSSSIALWILTTVAVLMFLRAASQLLIPIVLAGLVSFALEPVVAWLARHRVPRLAGTSLLLLSLLALASWGVYGLRDDVVRATEALPEAARRAREFITSSSTGPAASVQEATDVLRGTAGSSAGPGVSTLVQRGVGSIVTLAGHLMVIVFLVFFLLISGHHVRQRLVEISGPARDRRALTSTVIDDINAQIQRFLLVRAVTAAIVGVATWLVLVWLGVQNAAVWGILAGVFNSIPYFGPVIVSGGLFIIGLVQGGSASQALQMAGAALVITSLEGWLLTPCFSASCSGPGCGAPGAPFSRCPCWW